MRGQRVRHQRWILNTILNKAAGPKPAVVMLKLPQASGCECSSNGLRKSHPVPPQHWFLQLFSAVGRTPGMMDWSWKPSQQILSPKCFLSSLHLCDHGRYIDLADRLRSYSSVLYRWTVILVIGCLNNIVSLLHFTSLSLEWKCLSPFDRWTFFFFTSSSPQRLCLKDSRSHNNGWCFHEILTDYG